MKLSNIPYIIPAILAVILFSTVDLMAQKYSVASFRLLPNDVSAFITPVKDLNGEDCALIKVEAPEDFAFSTPLGIVKRIDKTGEIWLYLPKGSKKITLKHPEWGVMRDYKFPEKIDSHMTYELKVAVPVEIVETTQVKTVVNTVRDTLIVTRVDTMMVKEPKVKIPFSISALATVGAGGNPVATLGGVMVVAMSRHGGWAHVQTNFGSIGKTVGECDKRGVTGGNLPYYSGNMRRGCMLLTAGAIHRVSGTVNIFEGLGYGYDDTAWELAPSEGGGYVKNTAYSHRGIMFEVGATVAIRRFMISGSVSSIKGVRWFGSIGLGYKF